METQNKPNENKKKSSAAIGGLVFVGCLFIGAGVGIVFDMRNVGGAIGMGIGFILMALIWAYRK